jgi:ParB-like chromosome segregation protein Spo0J
MNAMEARTVNIADLEQPYADLKTRHARAEGRLLVSMQASGQKTPLFIIAGSAPGRYVVVDGHKRVRALKALKADVAQAHVWPLDAQQALARAYRMQQGSWNALEEAALVEELHRGAKWSLHQVADGLERTASWASRRLGLIEGLFGREVSAAVGARQQRGCRAFEREAGRGIIHDPSDSSAL